MDRVTTTVKVNPEKRDAAKLLGYDLTYILDKGLDQYISGIVITDNTVLDKLKKERRILMGKASDLTVKELSLRARRDNIELEIKALSEEIGAIEGKKEDDESSLRVTELLRDINSVIIDNEYDIELIETVVEKEVEELKEIMPSFELSKQIDIMKNFSN